MISEFEFLRSWASCIVRWRIRMSIISISSNEINRKHMVIISWWNSVDNGCFERFEFSFEKDFQINLYEKSCQGRKICPVLPCTFLRAPCRANSAGQNKEVCPAVQGRQDRASGHQGSPALMTVSGVSSFRHIWVIANVSMTMHARCQIFCPSNA